MNLNRIIKKTSKKGKGFSLSTFLVLLFYSILIILFVGYNLIFTTLKILSINSLLFLIIIFSLLFLGISTKILLKNKVNNYFIISIILIFIVLYVGITYIQKGYSPIPKEYIIVPVKENNQLIEENIIKISNMGCKSNQGYEEFVAGDQIRCSFNIKYKENSNYYLKESVVGKFNYNSSFQPQSNSPFFKEGIKKDGDIITYEPLVINLNEEGRWHYSVSLNFGNNESNKLRTFYHTTYTFNILNNEEYNINKERRISLIFALFSFAFFSIIVGMKNLRDLIER